MKAILKILIITIPLSVFSGQVLALRCGNRLVDIGDGKVKIIRRCGEPDFSETRERRVPKNCVESVYYRNDSEYRDGDGYRNGYSNCRIENIDVWTYNFGVTSFMRELIFVDGVLDEIKVLGYGY